MSDTGEYPKGQMSLDELSAVAKRRRRAGVPPQAPSMGLAFSGGGVRSATFCLGVLRGLAHNGVLSRFDYLSTVSGGGYVGAAWGRLFHPATTPSAVERGVADDTSLFVWWLRQNGRYLTPSGARDLFKTWTAQLRAFVAIQLEIALVSMLIACFIVSAHIIYAYFTRSATGWPLIGSAWCWALAVLLPIVATMMCSYWFVGRGLFAGIGVPIIATILGWIVYQTGEANPAWPLSAQAKAIAVCGLSTVPLGFLAASVAKMTQMIMGESVSSSIRCSRGPSAYPSAWCYWALSTSRAGQFGLLSCLKAADKEPAAYLPARVLQQSLLRRFVSRCRL